MPEPTIKVKVVGGPHDGFSTRIAPDADHLVATSEAGRELLYLREGNRLHFSGYVPASSPA